MSQQGSPEGETPAAADDWWNRLYEEPPPSPERPAGSPSPVDGDALDEHFATAAAAVADGVSEVAGPPALPEQVPETESVRPRARWEPESEPDPDPEASHGVPEAGPEAESGAVSGQEARGPVAPAVVPAPPPDAPERPVPAPLPRREPTERPGPVTVARSRKNTAEWVRPPDPRVAPAGAPEARPGYVGDGPPTYEPEPTALPPADPEALGEPVADTVADGARYGRWTLRAASVRGDSARFRGEHRGDALLTARFGAGDSALVLVAVASGGRGADDGHRAAADACRRVAAAVGRAGAGLAEDIRAGRRDVLGAGLHRLADRGAGRLRASDTGADTTGLRCLLLPADPRCRTRVFFGIGPGGLFRLRDGDWADLEPDGPAESFRFHTEEALPGDTLLLAGPGFAGPLRGAPGLADELARRWHPDGPPGLAAFLTDVQLRAKGYADDRTAVTVREDPG
ncbi:protein phosphatase 2C domain-containing protein [Streptomyces qinzhouensis]|uniref:Protein phosphatase 2C domain-containing protein n=1 Tax=Streptomyces qinzhouensis TaxID=2599401 RepID=A0A5B8IM38_9ACTN|nr:protein phosphatase 2C domain-containing protein [Streptomyces qinzhouensis]QDY79652.1 hypothetical protein FQU76_27465 [Streptomyces qinzhouensis]